VKTAVGELLRLELFWHLGENHVIDVVRGTALPFDAPLRPLESLLFPLFTDERGAASGQFFYERKFLFGVTISLAAQQRDD
jgi:hypothetical protein